MCGDDIENYSGTGMGGMFYMGVGGPPLHGASDAFPGHGGGGGGWSIDDLLIDTAQRGNPYQPFGNWDSLSPEESMAILGAMDDFVGYGVSAGIGGAGLGVASIFGLAAEYGFVAGGLGAMASDSFPEGFFTNGNSVVDEDYKLPAWADPTI